MRRISERGLIAENPAQACELALGFVNICQRSAVADLWQKKATADLLQQRARKDGSRTIVVHRLWLKISHRLTDTHTPHLDEFFIGLKFQQLPAL